MGKKLQQKPAVAEPTATTPAAEPVEESLTIQQKKANAKLLAKQMKHINAKVVAALDVKQVAKAAKALKDFQKKLNAQN